MIFIINKPNKNIRKSLLKMFKIEGDKHLLIKNILSHVIIDTTTSVCQIYDADPDPTRLVYTRLAIKTVEELQYVISCASINIPVESVQTLLRSL